MRRGVRTRGTRRLGTRQPGYARRIWSAIAIVALAVGASIAVTSPAAAAGGVSFSRDGVTWASSLPDPLFDESIRWVPGDMRETSVLVRNDGGDDSALRVHVRSGVLDDLFRESALDVAVRADGEAWQVTSRPGEHRLVDAVLADGDISRITVRVSMPASVDSTAQRMQLDFEVLVTLAQDVTDPPVTGVLASTGGRADLISLAIGVVAIVAGAALLAARQGSTRQRSTREGSTRRVSPRQERRPQGV